MHIDGIDGSVKAPSVACDGIGAAHLHESEGIDYNAVIGR